jgi:hypothetical protein
MTSIKSWIVLFAALAFAAFVHASPPPGTYELYNGEGQRTGLITSTFTRISGERVLTVVSKLEVYGLASTHHFNDTETVHLSSAGVTSFRRDTDEEGKKSYCEGQRAGKNFIVHCDRNGTKLSTSFPLNSFDMTEFEMDLASSTFRNLQPKQSKTLKVLFFDRMAVIPVSRNVGVPQTLPTNDGDAPVYIMNTVINGKPTTSWFHATTGDLLQEEGPDYLMTRIGP